jgi:hypothetical protein
MAITLASTTPTTYTADQVLTMKDERDELLSQLRKHYRTCAYCNEAAMISTANTGCWRTQILAQELSSLDEVLGYTEQEYGLVGWFYRDQPEQDDEIETDLSDLVADYVVTVEEQPTDRWGGAGGLDDADLWLRSQEGQRAVSEDYRPREAEAAEEAAAWIERTLWDTTIWGVVDSEMTQANLRAAAKVWTTKDGKAAVYKTFLNKVSVTDTGYTLHAYCAPCRKGVALSGERGSLLQAVLSIVKHAHTHVPGSELEFTNNEYGDSHVFINGSDAITEPGSDRAADIRYLIQAGNWIVQNEVQRCRLEHAQPTKLARAWHEFTEQLKSLKA